MADLSQLFRPEPTRRPYAGSLPAQAYQASSFDTEAIKRNTARQRVMDEVMRAGLSPEDGEPFFKFTARRLFELGDVEGAMATNAKAQEYQAAAAAMQQQGFENTLRMRQDDRAQMTAEANIQNQQADNLRADRQMDLNERVQAFNQAKYEDGASARRLDNLIKQQQLAQGVLDFELKSTELDKERVQLQEAQKELAQIGINWTPSTEMDKKTVLALNRGALAMRTFATDLKDYSPSPAVLAFIEKLGQGGTSPLTEVWARLTKSGLYAALSDNDRRYIMHALSIADMDLRPVSGAALPAGEVAGAIFRLAPQPNDTPAMRAERAQARADVWKGLAGTLPQEAVSAYPQMPDAALLSDAELEAIANGNNR